MKGIKVLIKGCIPCFSAVGIMYAVLFFLVCMLQLCFGVMTQEAYLDLVTDANVMLIATGCAYVVYMIVFYRWFQRLKNMTFSERISTKIKAWDCVCLISLGIVLQMLVSFLLAWILPHFPKVYQMYQQLLDGLIQEGSWLSFLITTILAPIGEELIFRGVTIALLEKELPYFVLNFLQAFLFGLYHMNVVQFVYAFGIGLILGLVYKKYNNLKACMLVHGTINLCANLLSVI